METENCFINCKLDELEAIDVDEQRDEGDVEGREIRTPDGFRRVEVVPVIDGSVGSRSSTCSQRSKLRLCVEMKIKNKMADKFVSDEDDKISNNIDQPVMVVIEYPDDVVVTVNAKIHKFEREVFTPDDMEDEIKQWENNNNEIGIENKKESLNSTFIKVPLSSTMIYPIIEEPETSASDVQKSNEDYDINETNTSEKKNVRKSNSGDASLYVTVMGGNDVTGTAGFGDISAIPKTDNESHEKASEALSSNNPIFGKHPSLKLNSSAMLFESEKVTPAEKLVKALHILARYRGVWGIYEDETRILKHLMDLNRLLTTTDTTTVLNVCREEDYLEVHGLISYFTLEKRFIIRSELLQTFTLLSQKSRVLSSFIVSSDIPVVLANEIENGNCATREMYAYTSNFLQMISADKLSEDQCEKIGEKFYGALCAMIIESEKKHYRALSEILFETLLHYHQQLGETDVKWNSVYSAMEFTSPERKDIVRKIKQKLTNILMRNVSLSPRSEDERNQNEGSGRMTKEVLTVLNDFMVCNDTLHLGLFRDAELDVVLVTLLHNLESNRFVDFHREALKTIHRILLVIKAEPTGLDKLERLVTGLMNEAPGSGDHDRCYRSVLKKIHKIVTFS